MSYTCSAYFIFFTNRFVFFLNCVNLRFIVTFHGWIAYFFFFLPFELTSTLLYRIATVYLLIYLLKDKLVAP